MERDLDVQREIWHRTLSEIKYSAEDDEADRHPCVICLDDVTEVAIALPCKHDQFDFVCLANWLEQRTLCPLCKSEIRTVRYEIKSDTDFKVYSVKNVNEQPYSRPHGPPTRPRLQRRRRAGESCRNRIRPELAVERRRAVYQRSLYSLHVGSNRISRFQDLSPGMFARDPELVSRARKWIRRELEVFEYLNPLSEAESRGSSTRSNNAEFLLEYIIAILKTLNIRDSSGQAEDMLQEFLGRDHAKLFLHELSSWLRSPYMNLEAWDSHVQYGESLHRDPQTSTARPSVQRGAGAPSRVRSRSVHHPLSDDDTYAAQQWSASRKKRRTYDSYRPQYPT